MLKEVGASPFQPEVPEVEVEGSGLATVGPSCDSQVEVVGLSGSVDDKVSDCDEGSDSSDEDMEAADSLDVCPEPGCSTVLYNNYQQFILAITNFNTSLVRLVAP